MRPILPVSLGILLLAALGAGCATTGASGAPAARPDWVDTGTRALSGDARVFVGVGHCPALTDQKVQHQRALARARREVNDFWFALVSSALATHIRERKEQGRWGPADQTDLETTGLARIDTPSSILHLQPTATWTDPADDSLWVMVRLDLSTLVAEFGASKWLSESFRNWLADRADEQFDAMAGD